MATLVINKEGVKYNDQQLVEMISISCCECGVLFAMTADLNRECKEQAGKAFYCPNGHGQHYSKSTAERLREELKRKEKDFEDRALENIRLSNQLDRANKTLDTTKKKLKKVERRITNGVCPCCNRSFVNLQCHMLAKHPEQIKKS